MEWKRTIKPFRTNDSLYSIGIYTHSCVLTFLVTHTQCNHTHSRAWNLISISHWQPIQLWKLSKWFNSNMIAIRFNSMRQNTIQFSLSLSHTIQSVRWRFWHRRKSRRLTLYVCIPSEIHRNVWRTTSIMLI